MKIFVFGEEKICKEFPVDYSQRSYLGTQPLWYIFLDKTIDMGLWYTNNKNIQKSMYILHKKYIILLKMIHFISLSE